MVPWVSFNGPQASGEAATVPKLTSEWPPRYLVPAWIERLGADGERLEEERGRPGVVDEDRGAAGPGDGRDRRHVLHLEGERARRLEIDDAGALVEERGDAGADMGIEIGGLDAEPLQHRVGEMADRAIDAIDHQHAVAALTEARSAVETAERPEGQRTAPAASSMSTTAASSASLVGVPRRP